MGTDFVTASTQGNFIVMLPWEITLLASCPNIPLSHLMSKFDFALFTVAS